LQQTTNLDGAPVRRPVKAALGLLITLGLCGTARHVSALENDGSLDSIARVLAGTSGPCPVSLTANVVSRADHYYLSFKLTNTSSRAFTMYRASLPWESIDSIALAAVTADGHLVLGGFPIMDNFDVSQVVLAPSQTLQGDYDLWHRWNPQSTPYTGLPHDKTIVLMWAYRMRAKELPAHPVAACSGVATFRTAK
jgi:hypothetical protein